MIQPTRLGLIARLTIATVVGGLLVGTISMFAVDRYATSALRDGVEETNRGLAERLALSFDDRVMRALSTLKLGAISENLTALDPVRTTSGLTAILRADPEFVSLSVYDLNGKAVATSSARSLVDPATKKRRKALVDEVVRNGHAVTIVEGRVPVLEISVPIESPPGTPVGALASEFQLEELGSFLSAFKAGTSMTGSLLDVDGRTLVHSDRGRIVRAEQIDVARGIADRPAFTTTIRRNGKDLILSLAPTTIFPGSVAIEQDLAEATVPIAGTRRMLVLLVLLSVAATAAVVSIAGRRVLAPIEPLMKAVTDLGAGDRSARAPDPTRNDEIGLLSEQFNRMAEAVEGLDRAKSEFVANAAHELRTPLTAISGLTELLSTRDKLSSDDLDNVCAALERQGARARILVERMLNLLRIESGGAGTTSHPVNVEQVIQHALESVPPNEGKTVDVAVGSASKVWADDVALEQVFSNLLTNAYRYGGSSVWVASSQSDTHVQISVEDDGVGVSESAAEHLFEPFNRGTQASGVGSGLGLAIVRRLMKAMDGSVLYEQRIPNGARFVIELPRHHG